LLGIELFLNFNLPYFSRNPSEFWRRWHISLSSWLRDYLYIPLGGNQAGGTRTYINLMITMLLGGLWHGAAWNFVLWGGYQGILLCGHRLLTHRQDSPLPRYAVTQSSIIPRMSKHLGMGSVSRWVSTSLSITVFFAFCCYGWLLFRAHSWHQIQIFTGSLLGFGPHVPSVISKPTTSAVLGMLLLALTQFSDYVSGRLESFRSWTAPLQGFLYASLVFVLIMGTSNAPVQFIYFQF
jgi:D-alanyl-lipoteichoic acid acyltransferase DltB (MBOAT superfamily)